MGSIRNFCFDRSRNAALIRYSFAGATQAAARELGSVSVGKDKASFLKSKVAHDFDIGSWLEQLVADKEQAEQPVEQGESPLGGLAACHAMWGMMGLPYTNGMIGPVAFFPPWNGYGPVGSFPDASTKDY